MPIEDPADPTPHLLRIGFRIFFLGAIVFALVAMLQWTLWLTFGWGLPATRVPATLWHGHEMIFGYAGAVIAGFLLTAVQNWTGRKTFDRGALATLFAFWLAARALALIPDDGRLWLVLVCDLGFLCLLVVALVRPLLASGNHGQWGIIGKLVLLILAELVFFLAVWGLLPAHWQALSLVLAIYVVVGLIVMVARRVMPFFTQTGIPEAGPRPNHRWVDLTSLVSFLGFAVADLGGWTYPALAGALVFAAVSALRLYGWHHPGIWSRPLLWVLYVGYGCVVAGVLMRAVTPLAGLGPSLGLHLMTYGGIGVFTTGMMARVSLGHTGRDVGAPPKAVVAVFALLLGGAVVRSLLPTVATGQYTLWLLVSQLCWLAAFALLLWRYAAILVGPRADGRYA